MTGYIIQMKKETWRNTYKGRGLAAGDIKGTVVIYMLMGISQLSHHHPTSCSLSLLVVISPQKRWTSEIVLEEPLGKTAPRIPEAVRSGSCWDRTTTNKTLAIVCNYNSPDTQVGLQWLYVAKHWWLGKVMKSSSVFLVFKLLSLEIRKTLGSVGKDGCKLGM